MLTSAGLLKAKSKICEKKFRPLFKIVIFTNNEVEKILVGA